MVSSDSSKKWTNKFVLVLFYKSVFSSFQSPGYRLISYIFLFLLQLAFLWPHFAKAFTLFCLPLRLQEDNMGKKKIWKKCPSSLDLLYHSTVCSFYINGSQDLLWIKLIQCFYVIVPTTFYTSLLFLTDHGFWNYFYAFCIFLP